MANDEDNIEILAIIEKGLRNNFPSTHRARYAIETAVTKFATENGDSHQSPDPEQVKEAIAKFRSMPAEVQAKALNGWSPAAIDISREESIGYLVAFPTVRLESGRGEFNGEFERLPAECARTCTLFIGVGSSKAEVLAALESLTRQIDEHWDRLIIDPLNACQQTPNTSEAP